MMKNPVKAGKDETEDRDRAEERKQKRQNLKIYPSNLFLTHFQLIFPTLFPNNFSNSFPK